MVHLLGRVRIAVYHAVGSDDHEGVGTVDDINTRPGCESSSYIRTLLYPMTSAMPHVVIHL